MKCPRCGNEMVMDGHRKIDLYMCYDCGYIEGRNTGVEVPKHRETNFERLRKLSFTESVAYLAKGLGLKEDSVNTWMERSVANSMR
jgi:Zn ribbon nucleic-acid-binding protein